MRKLTGYFQLLRPLNCSMMGLAVIVGEFIALRSPLPLVSVLLGFTTAFSLTGASMAVNDYYDRFVDAINEPNRPIPSGAVSSHEALAYAVFLCIIGLFAAILTSKLSCLVIAIIALVVSMAYSTRGKMSGLVGNFMVSFCVAIPFVYGGFIVGKGLEKLSLIFAIMAFSSNTGREITKGIADIKGDVLRNVNTIAVKFDPRVAAVIAVGFYLFAVGLSVLPWLLGIVSFLYLPLVVVSDLGFLASSISLMDNYSSKNAKRIKKIVIIWMLIGLLAFVAGSSTGETSLSVQKA